MKDNLKLRYTYHQNNSKDPIFLECYEISVTRFGLVLDKSEGRVHEISRVERNLATGTEIQYQPECVERHYYDTLQGACEGAVKTLRRKNEIE
jgi:hypothetical protein